jgi:hypothetical protein
MKKIYYIFLLFIIIYTPAISGDSSAHLSNRTIALWLFDEQQGLYPSCVISDVSIHDYPLVLGQGGQIVAGKYGNALEPLRQPPVDYPAGDILFGLEEPQMPAGRTVEPMTWMNADFCALMTAGEKHLRNEVGFANATDTRLNLGNFDWTVEFWYLPTNRSDREGTVFEAGEGPRGENDHVTRLSLSAGQDTFILTNQPSGQQIQIPSRSLYKKNPSWHHCAFVYDAGNQQLRHFLDGKLQSRLLKITMQCLSKGEEGYFSIGRDGLWQHPLPGRLDELRFSEGIVYQDQFDPPASFAAPFSFREGVDKLMKGPELLFTEKVSPGNVIHLDNRKYLFIDDVLLEKMENVTFSVNPPRLAEKVIDHIDIPFRKHLSIIEDENGIIRLYNGTYNDYLAVRSSRDGVKWEMPDVGQGEYRGLRNIVIKEPTGMGSVFWDPNAPPERRWKFVSDYSRRGIYLYSSADGWNFQRHKIAVLPFRSGSQSNVYYDDQRQLYVGYHRSDCVKSPGGHALRTFVITEVKDLLKPWPFTPVYRIESKRFALRDPQPWFLDNGPLTPGGFCQEYPVAFYPDNLDPEGVDIYVPKAEKYRWAPDTYLAFPVTYFHYEDEGPLTRRILMHPERRRGSGPIETQLAVSRDGVHWKRYHRPAYVGIGIHQGIDVHQAYLAQGMVRRGNEIWQYYYGTAEYHSAWVDDNENQAVFRVVQRLDGFISADSPYDREAIMVTRPLFFKGNRLVLNVDTDAAGYCQVGILNERGQPLKGFSAEDCIYINGDFVETEVEWLHTGKDLSGLAGKTVRLEIRMRASKLYALQFTQKND